VVGSLLSWPLAGGRKVSDSLLTTEWRMDYFSSVLKLVEAASLLGPHVPQILARAKK